MNPAPFANWSPWRKAAWRAFVVAQFPFALGWVAAAGLVLSAAYLATFCARGFAGGASYSFRALRYGPLTEADDDHDD